MFDEHLQHTNYTVVWARISTVSTTRYVSHSSVTQQL